MSSSTPRMAGGSRWKAFRWLAVAVVAGVVAAPVAAMTKASSAYVPGTPKAGNNVWLLLANTTNPRFEAQDRPFFIASMKKADPSAKVTVVNADGSNQTQLSQAQAALAGGADAIVLFANDSHQACSIVKLAHAAGVPVIAAEIPVLGCPVDYLAAVKVVDLGKLQGQWLLAHTKAGDNIAIIDGDPTDQNAHLFNQGEMDVLGPAFKSGARKLVATIYTPQWDASTAQTEMAQLLTKTSDNIQGVIGANDSMAQGVIAALNAQGMAGKVPVTGDDATLAGVQRILEGTQGMSNLISIKQLHQQLATIVTALLHGHKPPASLFKGQTNWNGVRHVPWASRSGIVITKANYAVAIGDGGFTKAQLCTGLPKGLVAGC